MAVSASHAALPYPVKGARFSFLVPYLDADGDPTAPTTPDTEISKDNGAAADCAEEVSATSGMDGMGLLTLSGAETDCSTVAINAKVASGPKATLGTFYPRVLPAIFSGTASAGAAGSLTLATDIPAITDLLVGCIIKTTGGTGGGGTGGANNQARVITAFNSSRVASVTPDWETTPDETTTYQILLTESSFIRLADVIAFGRVAATASSGRPEVNATHWGGTAVASANVLIDNAITAAKIAADAITDAKVASDVTIASVTGAVGSVTGNVGGNVVGSVGSLATQAKADVNAEADTAIADAALATAANLATVSGYLDTEIAAILADTNELQTDWANGGRLDLLIDAILADTGTDGVVISAATANAIADALLDRAAGVETNRTPRQALRLILAALVGKLSGAATSTVTIRDTNDGVNRVVATCDSDGNRSAVTLDAS